MNVLSFVDKTKVLVLFYLYSTQNVKIILQLSLKSIKIFTFHEIIIVIFEKFLQAAGAWKEPNLCETFQINFNCLVITK